MTRMYTVKTLYRVIHRDSRMRLMRRSLIRAHIIHRALIDIDINSVITFHSSLIS